MCNCSHIKIVFTKKSETSVFLPVIFCDRCEKTQLFQKNYQYLDQRSKKLIIKNCNLGNNIDQLKLLMTAIKENNTIESLNLSYNNLGQDFNNIKEIADLIKNDEKIKDLRLDNNNLECNIQNLKKLSTAIIKNKYLENLILTSNNLGIEYKKESLLYTYLIIISSEYKSLIEFNTGNKSGNLSILKH